MIPLRSISSICRDISASISGDTRRGQCRTGRSSSNVMRFSDVLISRGLLGFSVKTSFHLSNTLLIASRPSRGNCGFISNLIFELLLPTSTSICITSALVTACPPQAAAGDGFQYPPNLTRQFSQSKVVSLHSARNLLPRIAVFIFVSNTSISWSTCESLLCLSTHVLYPLEVLVLTHTLDHPFALPVTMCIKNQIIYLISIVLI